MFAARFLAFGEPLRPKPVAVAGGPHPREVPLSLVEINPPPLPQAYLALRRAVEDPLSTMSDVAAVIATDPGLSAYILRLANSALYSPHLPVETISRAVAVIGLAEVEVMALGEIMQNLFGAAPRSDLLRLETFWQHAVAVGVLSRALAERVGERGGERFFMAGLLHDVGRLVLAMAEPDLAWNALVRAAPGRMAIDVAERLEIGFDHAALGGRIAKKWRLPASLVDAVTGHHQPGRCPENLVAAAVHAADFMANALGVRASPEAGLPLLDERVLYTFNLTEADPAIFWEILSEGLEAMVALVGP